MGWVEERKRSDGSKSWRWSGRANSRRVSETFASKGDAYEFESVVAKHGYPPPGWVPGRGYGVPSDRTLEAAVLELIEGNTQIRDRTRADYKRMVTRYLTDSKLAATPVANVDEKAVRDWIRGLQNKDLAPKTIREVHALVSETLSREVGRGVLTSNPAKGLAPKKAPKPPFEVMDRSEAAAFVAVFPEKQQLFVKTLFETGLRWGEVTALQWRDVKNGRVSVRQAWKETAVRGRVEIGPPKSEAGVRTVPISAALAAELDAVRRKPNDWVFPTTTGSALTYGNYHYRVWRPAVRRAIEEGAIHFEPRIHDIRHTYASWLIASRKVSIIGLSNTIGSHTRQLPPFPLTNELCWAAGDRQAVWGSHKPLSDTRARRCRRGPIPISEAKPP